MLDVVDSDNVALFIAYREGEGEPAAVRDDDEDADVKLDGDLVAKVDTLSSVVLSAVMVRFSADVTLLAVALQTAVMTQPLSEPTHVSPPVQYAVHELLPTH